MLVLLALCAGLLGGGLVAFATFVVGWLVARSLAPFPSDAYGPLDDDRERYDRHLRRVARSHRDRVARWRIQNRIRAAIRRARAARTVEGAEGHMGRAEEHYREWRASQRAPWIARRRLERRYRGDRELLATEKYLNAARAEMRRLAGLKTERARERARGRVRGLLERALADPAADRAAIEAFALGLGLAEGQASPAGPPEPPADEVPAPVTPDEPEAPAWTPDPPPLAARRCPEDFERLLKLRHRRRFGSGQLAATPRARIASLAVEVGEELAPYARALGARRGRSVDLAVLALLPRELVDHHDEPPLEDLRGLLRSIADEPAPVFVAAARLLELWPARDRSRPTKSDCGRYAALLAHLGFGVEPDVRFGGPTWRDRVVALYPLASDAPHAPSRSYQAAALIVHVALAVGLSDTSRGLAGAEEDELRRHLETSLDLESAERRRLEVHLAWRLRHPPNLAGLKRRIAVLDEPARERLADFVLRVAFADGVVTPDEVRLLERLYGLLGRDPAAVHADLHARSSAAPAGTPAVHGRGVALDPARLRAKLAETARVSALLGDVFGEGEDEAPDSAPPPPPDGPTYAGLDGAHSALVAALVEREAWPRGEVEELAAGLGLLPDGALDAINDAVLDGFDAPLWEGDDPLWVDVVVGRAIVAGGASA